MIHGEYDRLCSLRKQYLDRAREASSLTIPTLFPMDGFGPSTPIETPYQSVGARGVNHLASKLLISLFPPNAPFFRLTIDDVAAAELDQDPVQKAVAMDIIAAIERRVLREVELRAIRVPIAETLKQLIVAGNALLYMPDKGNIRVFPITQYVCKRDPEGNVQTIITVENMARNSLTPELQAMIPDKDDHDMGGEKTVRLYTKVTRDSEDEYSIMQELGGVVIPDSIGSFTTDTLPFHALRWSVVNGEDYGRGLVEEYMGDLLTLEGLSKAITQGAAAAARVVGLVNPDSQTSPSDLNKAPNCSFILGEASDISFVQVGKFADFQTAASVIGTITKRLEAAFLLSESITRNAERVTAEEIRLMANELESALGGVYAVLSQSLQLPMVKSLMRQLQKAQKVPAFKGKLKEAIQPAIITGVEALGRSSDLERLRSFVAVAVSILGPQEIAGVLNHDVLLRQIATSVGIDITGLVKSPEEIAQERAAQQQQELMQTMVDRGTSPAITAVNQQYMTAQEPGT